MLRVDGHFVATTVPADVCTDCTQGALAFSANGTRWRDVTPRFPCGTSGRSSYGFVSRPVAVGSSIAVLGGCGQELSAFDQTLVAISSDGGARWRIRQLNRPTGGPLPAAAGHHRIVTLTTAPHEQVRAVVVHR
jgi:hypothetical protein